MKIIHTADIHLDSPLSQVGDSAVRRHELLRAVADMAQYADNNGVTAIIIAGDLFDGEYVSAQTLQSVADIVNASKAQWFVLKGNHGSAEPYLKLKKLAPRINFFGKDWTYFNFDGVTICGRELGGNDREQYASLSLPSNCFNIVVLHGDVEDDCYGLIDLKSLAQSGVNYAALGHRHAFAGYKVGNMQACYSGVLESRGFDEPSKSGFVLIDTADKQIKFVEQYIRRIERIKVDVTNVSSDIALENKIADAVNELSKRNYLDVVFVGELQSGLHLEIAANNVLQNRFFALRTTNQTVIPYNIPELTAEVSLRGEFVKLALQLEDEALRTDVLKYGLKVLGGDV